jgi:hypothetical protein
MGGIGLSFGKQTGRLGRETTEIGKTNGAILGDRTPIGFPKGLFDSLPAFAVSSRFFFSLTGKRERRLDSDGQAATKHRN